jgi:hypothetical protein
MLDYAGCQYHHDKFHERTCWQKKQPKKNEIIPNHSCHVEPVSRSCATWQIPSRRALRASRCTMQDDANSSTTGSMSEHAAEKKTSSFRTHLPCSMIIRNMASSALHLDVSYVLPDVHSSAPGCFPCSRLYNMASLHHMRSLHGDLRMAMIKSRQLFNNSLHMLHLKFE